MSRRLALRALSVACAACARDLPVDRPGGSLATGTTVGAPTAGHTATTTDGSGVGIPGTTTDSVCRILHNVGAVWHTARVPEAGGYLVNEVELSGAPISSYVNTLFEFDGYLWSCGLYLHRIHLGNQRIRAAGERPCLGAFVEGGVAWVDQGDGRFTGYVDAVGLFDGTASAWAGDGLTLGRAVAVDGDRLIRSHHVTVSELDVYDRAAGTTTLLPLEGYDDRVWGLTVVGGQLHVLDHGAQGGVAGEVSVWTFDRWTGAFVDRVPVGRLADGHLYRGLLCES